MKTTIYLGVSALLFSGLLAHSASAAGSSDYPVKFHVSSSQLKNECETDTKGSACGFRQLLAVTIEGKKYTLESQGWQSQLLPTGDYQGRVTKDEKGSSGAYDRIYELLFSNGKTAKYQVVGEFE